jgi:hypothetical protein
MAPSPRMVYWWCVVGLGFLFFSNAGFIAYKAYWMYVFRTRGTSAVATVVDVIPSDGTSDYYRLTFEIDEKIVDRVIRSNEHLLKSDMVKVYFVKDDLESLSIENPSKISIDLISITIFVLLEGTLFAATLRYPKIVFKYFGDDIR